MTQQFERILPGQFMNLSKELRDHIAGVFHVAQSGATEVRNDEVVSDGRTFEDLAVITKEAMLEYVGSTEDFLRAWELTVRKAYSELHPSMGVIRASAPAADLEPTVPQGSAPGEVAPTNTTPTKNAKEKKGK